MENSTPMLKQYHTIKSQHKDCILFFRLGDFYEMFYDDAKIASNILGVVLTSRGTNTSGKVPMCGIPYHAADNYISKLIKAGLKVAICDQIEDPAIAKGIVKRNVTRIISTGTYIDENNPSPRYLLSITFDKKTIGIAFTDTTSGIIYVNEFSDFNQTLQTITKLPIYECIYPSQSENTIKEVFKHTLLKNVVFTVHQDWCFNPDIAQKTLCEHFSIHNLRGFGIETMSFAIAASGALLEYLKLMNQQPMKHIHKISLYSNDKYVFISPAACYGLELESLVKTMDHTLTPLGKRLLHDWIYHPLNTSEKILERQDAVTLLKNNLPIQQKLKHDISGIPDIEKSISRISCGYYSSRDLLALRNTLFRLPEIQETIRTLQEKNILFSITDIPEIRKLLTEAINPDLPLSNPEGKIINKGYNQELDSLRDIQENFKQWLKNLQAQEIERTGINSLKIGYTSVFGYYIEISKANLHLVPSDYIRKQTLVNAERFITPQLKEFEEKIITAESNILRIETEILKTIYNRILTTTSELHQFTSQLATIDVVYSLSVLSLTPNYIMPHISNGTDITIENGRHPVVEKIITESFIPNDTLLDTEKSHLIILTGPNMAGKSTYIRQVALLVIMAQIGSYIPADTAKIGIVDKIFTRIGAHDEITKGQSTFMVEMSETAGILNNLSPRSLLILDEIGRGTSTYDGLSLAWAIVEYLQKEKVRTLFATHFHELTALAEEYPGVKNYNVAVKEWGETILFLHKIIQGSTDDSYGIYVAKIAGIPQTVIKRAQAILTQLEIHGNLQEKIRNKVLSEKQLSLFTENNNQFQEKITQEIHNVDINTLTPLAALQKIQDWKKIINEYKNDNATI